MPDMPNSAPEMPEIKPSLTLDGDAAAPFMDYDVGHTCRISGDFKVISKSDHDSAGPSIRLEATGPVAPEGSPEEEASETPDEEAAEQEAKPAEEADENAEPDEEEKALGYKRPQVKKESYNASAKDMEE